MDLSFLFFAIILSIEPLHFRLGLFDLFFATASGPSADSSMGNMFWAKAWPYFPNFSAWSV